jgi:hypothetical protein
MGDELATLATKIQTTEEKIEKLERHIVNNDFAGTPYDDRAEAKAALKALTAEKAALQNKEVALQNEKVELIRKENLLLQQQQSGAGTSMPPVLHEVRNVLLSKAVLHTPANFVAFRGHPVLQPAQLWPAAVRHVYCIARLRISMQCKL